jgi:ribosomal protein S18 acetylase RimI-like enzyme
MKMIPIREAQPSDAAAIAALIHELAESSGETSPITAEYARHYLAQPGSRALLAVQQEGVIGLLSYSIRPNLYHAANSAQIEELVVASAWRGKGVGGALLEALLLRLEAAGVAEVSVTTLPDNEDAIRFYRSHGLVDEAVFLEKHWVK